MPQEALDTRNAEFWNELCGLYLDPSLGLADAAPESLARFDRRYLDFYPYLAGYVHAEDVRGKKVLEIGLGSGTLGQLLASSGCEYFGLDIAPNPVQMMRHRLALLGQDGEKKVQVGSALEIPHADASFDYVYSVGCLHHTGNLPRCVSEVYRVLGPRGKAVIMLYNRHSFRQVVAVPLKRVRQLVSDALHGRPRQKMAQFVRSAYDRNLKGDAAPHTDFVSRREARHLFRRFSSVRIDVRNFDAYAFLKGRIVIPREKLLDNLGRVMGLDFYIVATK